MKSFIVTFSFILAFATGQFPFNDDELVKPWNGPIANHQLGLPPGDTAEVAAAKQAHLKAFQDVLAVLPELPPEERYRKNGLPLDAVLALMRKAHQQVNVPTQQFSDVHRTQPIILQQPVQPIVVPTSKPISYVTQPPVPHVPEHHFVPQPVHEFVAETPRHPVFSVLAEDIPRSPFGEVPEVYAARIAHLKAYNDAVAYARSSSISQV